MPYLVQHVNTGKIYKTIGVASDELGIARAVIENCLKKGCSWNLHRFEYVSEKVETTDDGIKIGDYILVRSGTIFLYGSILSLEARSNLTGVNILEHVSKATRDKLGRFIVEIDCPDTLELFKQGYLREVLRRQKIRYSK